MSDAPEQLNDCGCCEGITLLTPVAHENPPGLPALNYRAGTHGSFKATMQAGLAGQPPLRPLTTRSDDDPTIALLDGWALTLDVLTFYQERIANEGFLRTATERRSLLELAQAIAYQPSPGVAAGTHLAFTVDETRGSPKQVALGEGIKAQSIPEQDEKPQTFETVESIVARAEWNRLRPRLRQPQVLTIEKDQLKFAGVASETGKLFFQGTAVNLKAGDLLLVVIGAGGAAKTITRRVRRAIIEADLNRTRVELDLPAATSADELPSVAPATQADPPLFSDGTSAVVPFQQSTIQALILNRRWREQDLQTFLQVNRWDADQLIRFIDEQAQTQGALAGQNVFTFRERVGFFGHNAPSYQSLRVNGTTYLYTPDWDSTGWQIWNNYPGNQPYSGSLSADAFLERSLPSIVTGGWAVFESGANALSRTYRVASTTDSSLVAFGITGKATGLKLQSATQGAPDKNANFLVRTTTAYVQSERLELAALPVNDTVPAQTQALLLDRMTIGLRVGQSLALTGERANAAGVRQSELLTLAEIFHRDGFTTLVFKEGLSYAYLRHSLTLNANVARATHGESKREVLGSGDASQPWQRFVLKQPPLTYASAPTTSGRASTLQVRVHDLLWDPAPSFFQTGATDRIYTARPGDGGKTTVQFGDGQTGARLPSGTENVVATYRSGLGRAGRLKAGQISLLLSRPLGLKEVTNPMRSAGGADPETVDELRENAPFTVLTLGRIVSLQDFADFARGFAGIAKAQAVWLWDGQSKIVHLTVAGSDGEAVEKTSDVYKNLLRSIDLARDFGCHVRVDSYQPGSFNVAAKVLVQREFIPEKVRAAVAAALLGSFSFGRRDFGQGVTKSELLAVMQRVEGVEAVDLDAFYLSTEPVALAERLPARTAQWNQTHTGIEPAELLLINSYGVKLSELKA